MSLAEPESVCEPGEHLHAPRKVTYTHAECEKAAGMFRMLGDAARLRLLAWLAAGEMCVSDLASQMNESLSNVSHRLRLLKAERLVAYRRIGKHVYYRLADDHILQMVHGALDHAREPER
jgi:ArsR family transcriptional regulator